jgi:phage shock protein A
MEERIEHNERQLKAAVEINEEFSGDRLASDFKQLERQAGGVSADQALLALKQKMGLLGAGASGTPKQISAGKDEEVIAAEIERADDEHSR